MLLKSNLTIISLSFLILIALFTRLYHLNTLPPSLFSDEVDAGYQALVFNFQKTDYYGNFLPTHFHSFSDWRTSAEIYSIALAQKLGVPLELSVRLPSAIYGLIFVISTYFFTQSFVTAFLVAISPWAIHYSRTGFEVMGMLSVLISGLYFWKKYIHSQAIIDLLLAIFLVCLTPYFYSTAKLFLIFVITAITISWWSTIKKIPVKHYLLTVIFAVLFLSPMLLDTLKGRSGYRFSYISIFTEPHREQITDTLRYEDILLSNPNQVGVKTPLHSFIYHNKWQLVINKFINNYYSSFSTNFLFLNGDQNLRHGFRDYGLLYFLDLVFIIVGLGVYIKKPTSIGKFFLITLILSPIPYALTRDSVGPHSTRLILMLPPLLYFSGLGLKKYIWALPIYLLSFITFWHFYNTHYPQISARQWHTGYKEAILATAKFPVVYYSIKDESVIPFFLFYKQVLPPPTFIKTNNQFFDGQTINNQYFFGHLNLSNPSVLDSNAVYVVDSDLYHQINSSNNYTVIEKITKRYIEAEEIYILKVSDAHL